MNYVVVNREDMRMTDAEELASVDEVQAAILEKIKAGKDPAVYVEIEYNVNIKVKEDKRIEAPKDKTEHDQSTGGKSHGKVRRGDEGVTETVSEGSGDTGADPGTENK